MIIPTPQLSHDSNSAWVKLLLGLRNLVRRSSAVLWVSAPAWVVENSASADQSASHNMASSSVGTAGTARISHLGDIGLDVHSFVGNGSFSDHASAGFGDFDGILRIARLPAFHSIAPPAAATATAETPNYLFKVRRAISSKTEPHVLICTSFLPRICPCITQVKRKGVLVERLALPPDEELSQSAGGCSGHTQNGIASAPEPRLPSQLDF
jgi:hypothetical protein